MYYLSAGFLTFEQSDLTSRLSADRPLLRLECRVAARVRLGATSATWESIVRCRGSNENWHSRPIAEYRAGEDIAWSASQPALFHSPQNGQRLDSYVPN